MAQRNEPQRPPPAPRLFSRLSLASRYSFLSHSSSFEADDERSSTTTGLPDFGTMSPRTGSFDEEGDGDDDARYPAPARYAAEDTRPTSPKELAGWYAYAFAAEVYVICGQ
jgi:UMF1 family MFS transporter